MTVSMPVGGLMMTTDGIVAGQADALARVRIARRTVAELTRIDAPHTSDHAHLHHPSYVVGYVLRQTMYDYRALPEGGYDRAVILSPDLFSQALNLQSAARAVPGDMVTIDTVFACGCRSAR